MSEVIFVRPSQIHSFPDRNTGRRDLTLQEIAVYYRQLFWANTYNPMNEKGKETVKSSRFTGWNLAKCAGLIAHPFEGSKLPPEVSIAKAMEERVRMLETIGNMGDKTGAEATYRTIFYKGTQPLRPEYFLDTGNTRFRALPWILAGCTPAEIEGFRIPITVLPYVDEDFSFDATLDENVTTEKKGYTKAGLIAIAVRLLRRGLGETAIARKLGIPLKRRTYVQEIVGAGRACIVHENDLHLLDRLFLKPRKIQDADGKDRVVYEPDGFVPAEALRRGELLTLMGGKSAVKKDGTPHDGCGQWLQPDHAAAPPAVWEQLFQECCTGKVRIPHRGRETILQWGKLFENKPEQLAPIYRLLTVLCEDPLTKEGQAYLEGLTQQGGEPPTPQKMKGSKPK